MKILTLIVHTNIQQELADLLRSLDQAIGFTFTPVKSTLGKAFAPQFNIIGQGLYWVTTAQQGRRL